MQFSLSSVSVSCDTVPVYDVTRVVVWLNVCKTKRYSFSRHDHRKSWNERFPYGFLGINPHRPGENNERTSVEVCGLSFPIFTLFHRLLCSYLIRGSRVRRVWTSITLEIGESSHERFTFVRERIPNRVDSSQDSCTLDSNRFIIINNLGTKYIVAVVCLELHVFIFNTVANLLKCSPAGTALHRTSRLLETFYT